MVDYLSARLGPLPYPGLAHVAVPLAPAGRPGASVVLYDGARLHAGEVTEREVARATAAQWLGNAVDEAGLEPEQPSAAASAYLAWLWSPRRGGGKKPSAGEALPARCGRVPAATRDRRRLGLFPRAPPLRRREPERDRRAGRARAGDGGGGRAPARLDLRPGARAAR